MPQLNNEPPKKPEKEAPGILDSLKSKANKLVQVATLLGALASAGVEDAEAQSISRGPTYSSKASPVFSFSEKGNMPASQPKKAEQKNISNAAKARGPQYSVRGTVVSHGERTTGSGVGRAHGQVNLPKTGFQKEVEAYHGGKMPPTLSQGFRSGTVSKRVDIGVNLKADTLFKSGITKPKPRNR